MAAGDKILSQVEIDNILSKNVPKLKPKPPGSDDELSVKSIDLHDLQPAAPPPPPPKADTKPSSPPSKVEIKPSPPPELDILPSPPSLDTGNKPSPPKDDIKPSPPAAAADSSGDDVLDELANLQKTVADLVEHVVKLASDVQRIDDLEEEIEQLAKMVKNSSKKTDALEERINDIQYALEAVSQNKSDSLRDEFICSKCQSKKTVVFHVKCTTCGNESWMGWWPKTKRKK